MLLGESLAASSVPASSTGAEREGSISSDLYSRAAEQSSKRAQSVASLADIVFSVGGHLGISK